MATLDNRRSWGREQQQQGHGRGGKWEGRNGVPATDAERELYERARNAASEAEGEGDAQLRAALAAARVVNQAVVTPIRLNFWSLRFHCDRLEAAYCRKSATNSEYYDYVPVFIKTALCLSHVLLIFSWFPSPTSHLTFKRNCLSSIEPEFTFHKLWSMCATLTCGFTLGIQLIWPLWYRSNRGTTLQYLVMFLWVWESAKLLVNANAQDANVGFMNVCMEVVFMNVFMSVLHRVPFSSHCQLRSYGGVIQVVAILCKSVDVKMRLQILCLAVIGHTAGLGLAYFLDRYSRKQFLRSLPVWLLDDFAGNDNQATGYLSYRASLSQQMWSIFYPELLNNPQPFDKPVTYSQVAAPRALGGFAGGFGGVSSLKGTRPYSSNISPPSSSSSFSGGGSSNSSSDGWGGVGQTGSGISCDEMPQAAQDLTGTRTSAPVLWGMATTSSASSQVGQAGLKSAQSPSYVRSRAETRGGGISGGYYY